MPPRSKSPRSYRSKKSVSSGITASPRESATYGGFSGAFAAAKQGGYRGWFFFPTLDAVGQMPGWSRFEINKKANWLYNNVPEVRTVIDGLTLDEVDCGLWPKWVTSNPDFNKAVTDAFHNDCGDARFFHAAGKETFYSAQWMIRRSIRLYGEIYAQFLRPTSQNASPLCHFINAWQCGNTPTGITAEADGDRAGFNDGIAVDSFGRVLRYLFCSQTTANGLSDADTLRVVDASDIIHMHDQFFAGQQHGMSGLASCARKLFSMDDIDRAAISGSLLRERIAYAITREEDGDGLPTLLPGAAETITIPATGGGKMIVQRIMAMDDTEVDVAELPAGQDLKVVESSRSSSTPEFINYILRSVAHSTLYPPEYVFNLAGIGQGTLVRLVQKRVQRIKNTVRNFQLADQFCKRWITYWTWQRIAAGKFDAVPGGIPDDWWRHKLVMPSDDTVDVAREGKLYDARLHAGDMSPADYHGMQGRDDEDVEDEVIAAAVRKAKKIKAAMDANPDIADLLRFQLEALPGRVAEAPQEAPEDDPNAVK